ncbi:MAG: OmpH family outer membrane protein [Porphyromonadaceae bacterium]|jgi:outer membrane protein|nr:OmpH family outer membrane protein [Porphyromonadaceae bacterium]MDD6313953.1 OmpH family outer membrane protein [Porphyromonadaceae bacterium]
MIKKLLIALAVFFPMLASAQTVKIGLVNFNTILAGHPDTQAAQTKLQDAQKKYDAEYQKLGQEFQRMFEEYQKGTNDLPAIKQRKEQELQDYQNKIQQFEQSAAQDLQKMQADLMQPIIAKVQQAIESVGKEGGYTLIQNLDPQIVFYHAAPAVDITNDVKAKLGMK